MKIEPIVEVIESCDDGNEFLETLLDEAAASFTWELEKLLSRWKASLDMNIRMGAPNITVDVMIAGYEAQTIVLNEHTLDVDSLKGEYGE